MRRILRSVAASSFPSLVSVLGLLAVPLLLVLPGVLSKRQPDGGFNPAVVPEARYQWHLHRMGFVPVLRNDWLKHHNAFVAESRKRPIDLLFLGDSITEAWEGPGKAVWNEHYAHRNAAHFGITGDRTENLLWRLENGELQNIHPKVAVVLIGTNNIPRTPGNSPGEIAAGVAAVAQKLIEHSAETKVLLIGLFPRADFSDTKLNERVADVNPLIQRLADNRRVFFLDVHDAFLGADGTPSPDLLPDLLHPNAKGYEIWAKAVDEKLAVILDESRDSKSVSSRSSAAHVTPLQSRGFKATPISVGRSPIKRIQDQ